MTVLAERIRDLDAAGGPAHVFHKAGEYWTICFDGSPFQLRDERGLGYIAILLAHPNEQIHALELVAPGDDRVHRLGFSSADPLLDDQAKAAYRTRLADLREELDEAESWGDSERAATLSAELGFLTDELARAVGLGGRDRLAATPAERARISVTKAIRRATAKVAKHDSLLGEHLAVAIRTGTFCSYRPGEKMGWEVASR